MVIQRWQSVYLLLAVFAMILVFIRPFGFILDESGTAAPLQLISVDYPILIIINLLIGLLLLIDIFLFKNLAFQRLVAAVCILMIIVSAVTTFIILTKCGDMWQIAWAGAPVGLVCALICTLLARYRMGIDQKILRSYDRLR